jgi:hypothetical protein
VHRFGFCCIHRYRNQHLNEMEWGENDLLHHSRTS